MSWMLLPWPVLLAGGELGLGSGPVLEIRMGDPLLLRFVPLPPHLAHPAPAEAAELVAVPLDGGAALLVLLGRPRVKAASLGDDLGLPSLTVWRFLTRLGEKRW